MGKNIIIIITIVLILFMISYNYAPGFGLINRRFDSPKIEKYSKYECGEETIDELKKTEESPGRVGSPRGELYIKYYMIALTYLLFDIEIILLFPYISYLISYNNIMNLSLYSSNFILIFFFFVLIGLLLEYLYGLFN